MTLPTWFKDPAGKWYCDDKDEWAFAQKCQFIATEDAFFNFDLPAFDRWLIGQPEGEAKTKLLAIRAKAKATRSVAARLAYLADLKANEQAVPRLRNGQRKGPRSARRPQLAAWLDRKLRLHPDAKVKELLRELPDEVAGETLYRLEDGVTELRSDGTPMPVLTFAGFEGQVTAARKRAKQTKIRG